MYCGGQPLRWMLSLRDAQGSFQTGSNVQKDASGMNHASASAVATEDRNASSSFIPKAYSCLQPLRALAYNIPKTPKP